MTAQEVNFSNFYESTLATGSGGLPTNVVVATLTAAPTSNGTSAISAPYYLVVDPDSATKREVIEVTAATGTSLSTIVRDKEGRYGVAGDASTAPNHAEGTVVRMAVVKEMFEDVHDRIDAGFVLEDGDGTEVNVTSGKEVKFVEGAAMNIDWTDVSDGTDADPYDMTFSVDINGATDGTGITVDLNNDLLLLYDATDATVKKVNGTQVAPPVEVHPFLVMGG